MSDTFKSEKRDRRPPRHENNRKRIAPLRIRGDKYIAPLRANDNNYTDRQALEDEWLDDQE